MIKIRDKFGKLVEHFTTFGIAACFFTMIITTLDVIIRKISTLNIKGSYELTELAMVVVVFLGIASLQAKDGHVKVDMLVMKLPPRLQHLLLSTILFIEFIMYSAMSYSSIIKCIEYFNKPVYTAVLKFSYVPFYFIMIIGLVCFSILLLFDSIIQLIGFFDSKYTEGLIISKVN